MGKTITVYDSSMATGIIIVSVAILLVSELVSTSVLSVLVLFLVYLSVLVPASVLFLA